MNKMYKKHQLITTIENIHGYFESDVHGKKDKYKFLSVSDPVIKIIKVPSRLHERFNKLRIGDRVKLNGIINWNVKPASSYISGGLTVTQFKKIKS